MCGLAGFFNLPQRNRGFLDRLTDAVAHRGPDGRGTFVDEPSGAGLGHRRLAILDLSDAAAQPMTFQDSGRWVVFNGEVFNFIELKAELESKGYRFKTTSDTEVALAAFLEWDVAAFSRFNGMWAMAVLDTKNRRLVLSVDRFGVKPLYFRKVNGGLAFASEQKAFWAVADELPLRWDMKGLKTALVSPGALEASGHTLLEGVESLQGGHLIDCTSSRFEVKRWWDTGAHLSEPPADFKRQAERFREIFYDSCRLRLRSDVPVGTALSGGVDSSAVATVISRLRNSGARQERAAPFPHKAFIHEFRGTSLDESGYARAVTDELGLEPVAISATPEEVVAGLDDGIVRFETVYHGVLDAPSRLYRAEREHGCLVSLDGHGADEILGGYHNYTYAALLQSFPNPGRMKGYLDQIKEQTGLFFSWRGLAFGLARDLLPINDASAASAALKRLTDPIYGSLRGGISVGGFYRPIPLKVPDSFDLVNRALYEDFHQRILPRILKNFDVTSMAHGVEVRMPFMDHRLVTYAFSLPSSSKIGGGYTKRVLREALAGEMPEAIRLRKLKLGFNSPLLEWLPDLMRPWVESTLAQEAPSDGLIDRVRLSRFYRESVLTKRFSWSQAVRFWAFTSAVRLTQLMRGQVAVKP